MDKTHPGQQRRSRRQRRQPVVQEFYDEDDEGFEVMELDDNEDEDDGDWDDVEWEEEDGTPLKKDARMMSTPHKVQLAIGGTTFGRNLEHIRKQKPNSAALVNRGPKSQFYLASISLIATGFPDVNRPTSNSNNRCTPRSPGKGSHLVMESASPSTETSISLYL